MPEEFSNDSLKNLFLEHVPTVFSAKVIDHKTGSKKIGFVIVDTMRSAETAIRVLNRSTIGGSRILVKLDEKKMNQSPSDSTSPKDKNKRQGRNSNGNDNNEFGPDSGVMDALKNVNKSAMVANNILGGGGGETGFNGNGNNTQTQISSNGDSPYSSVFFCVC